MADLVYPPVVVVLKTFWKYLGLRFDFEGDENIPRQGGAILAMNHVGYLDFALIGTAALPVKRYVRFMAKKEIFENKIAGPLMRCEPHTTAGITGTPAPIANRTAPDLNSFNSKLTEIVPSGKMPTISPALSARRAATNEAEPLERSTLM